jgi:biopolymer transport protein ExbD
MAIRYHCPNCGQFLSISGRLAGHRTTCPTCKTQHSVPLSDEVKTPNPTRVPKRQPVAARRVETEPPLPEKETPSTPERATPPGPASAPALSEGPSFPISYEVDPLEDDDDEEALVIGKMERKSDELDLIPMVDCVFLLLVFYMITATYAMQKAIEMGKPAADKKGAVASVQTADDTPQSKIVVQIDARNRIFVDDVPLDSVGGLSDRLRSKMNGELKNELVIEADPRAFHETIVAVVDAAHELQFQHVRMAMTAGEND